MIYYEIFIIIWSAFHILWNSEYKTRGLFFKVS